MRRTAPATSDSGWGAWADKGPVLAWLGPSPPPALGNGNGLAPFRLILLDAGCPQRAEHSLRVAAPVLVLADAAWCAGIGAPALQKLRGAQPGSRWLLCWHKPAPQWLATLIAGRFDGVVDCHEGVDGMLRALRAVLAGDVWFPRRVTRWLYTALLDTAPAGTDRAGPVQSLTAREAQALVLLRDGLTNRAIAEQLGISVNTVKKHLAAVFEKRGLRNRRQLRG